MSSPILTLRVSRRALAAAMLENEELVFVDSHYLPANRNQALAGTARYLTRLLDMLAPKKVAIEAASHDGSQTMAMLEIVRNLLAARQIPSVSIDIIDILHAYGIPGLRSRQELRGVLATLFPALETRGPIKPYVIDAAAAALFVETRVALGLVPT